MNDKVKKFNLTIGILALICILLSAAVWAVTVLVLQGYTAPEENAAGAALGLAILFPLIFMPTAIVDSIFGLIIAGAGINVLVLNRRGELASKGVYITVAVLEILSVPLLLLGNGVLMSIVPVISINCVLAAAKLVFGIATCIFIIKFTNEKALD